MLSADAFLAHVLSALTVLESSLTQPQSFSDVSCMQAMNRTQPIAAFLDLHGMFSGISLFCAGDGDAGPAEGASYWASLLSEFAGHMRDEDQDDLNKGMRKRNRTEKAAAALASKSAPPKLLEDVLAKHVIKPFSILKERRLMFVLKDCSVYNSCKLWLHNIISGNAYSWARKQPWSTQRCRGRR